MHDVGQFFLGLMLSTGVLILVPLYLLHEETKTRENKEKQENKKSDCP